ncbi:MULTISPECIES: FAD-binding oxidoreductase [unclassified Beijerinckia]|uniref:NAD(P)/FAD-dependent oxidoreductase n=1 Tax=unclassified Beijerinckia TaxID=2638183 RepID=UPI000896ABA0|nr:MULTISPECIES: FAD-binding oxidoreductase [unclassified Beijerinckia]MDH7795542.1 glycine/D-amino acid oxidase-like deaminating enzyme [Beijerinckia sp. GAS462]SEC05848.1 Glycine/D-amino acid oxidase [Beijerinckia sp. 28-YEA-48]
MATSKLDLRTGTPIWLGTAARGIQGDRLQHDVRVDVLVVGAGISGALTAEALVDAGMRVAIVDRRGAAKGSTAASTALVQYEIDEPLTLLSKKIGPDNAIRAWRRSALALGNLRARTRELGFDCGLDDRSSLYLSGDRLGREALRLEGEARRAAGLESVFLGRRALLDRFSLRRDAGLLSFGNMTVDPRRLTLGYLRAAIAAGATLHAPVEVTKIEASARLVLVKTKQGPVIRCRHLVYATGYEIPYVVPAAGHKIISTFALATEPQTRRLWPERCLIWEASDPYLYMRTTPDGRVIAGGEDEEFADEAKRDALLQTKVARIARGVGRLFPDLDMQPAYAWTGSFGTTATGLPSIGAIPGLKNCWAILGFGGNGITYSRIASEIMRAHLTGRADPDADLYAFSD